MEIVSLRILQQKFCKWLKIAFFKTMGFFFFFHYLLFCWISCGNCEKFATIKMYNCEQFKPAKAGKTFIALLEILPFPFPTFATTTTNPSHQPVTDSRNIFFLLIMLNFVRLKRPAVTPLGNKTAYFGQNMQSLV